MKPLIPTLAAIVWLACGYWTVRDALKRDRISPAKTWHDVIVFLFMIASGFINMLVYLCVFAPPPQRHRFKWFNRLFGVTYNHQAGKETK